MIGSKEENKEPSGHHQQRTPARFGLEVGARLPRQCPKFQGAPCQFSYCRMLATIRMSPARKDFIIDPLRIEASLWVEAS